MTYKINKNPVSSLKRVGYLIERVATKRLSEFNIPHSYSSVILCLYDTEGKSQAELVKSLGLGQPTVVRTLDRMERDGFIKRKQSNKDRRIQHIYLTKKGQMAHRNVEKIGSDLLNDLFSNFSKTQVTEFEFYLDKLKKTLEENI